jgi:hypothetical protein
MIGVMIWSVGSCGRSRKLDLVNWSMREDEIDTSALAHINRSRAVGIDLNVIRPIAQIVRND